MLRVRDDQWERVPDSRPGRQPIPTRALLEAVLWILNTGAQWHFLPQCYPNDKKVHRRFQQWCQQEVLREVLTQLANTLRDDGVLDERESFIDATFAAAKGGGEAVGLTKRGKDVKILAIVDRHGFPLSASTHAANHHEVTVIQLSFDF
ncbi:MAG: transposase [Nitrospira sp.]|nr:transposase [Nitrospira sp.]MDH4371290.1 transposase [Nitrospira sp.]MDH5498203.1 transposase [Nitrospira sp.]MDH5724324.1 transposase [Nitrospira sp.]